MKFDLEPDNRNCPDSVLLDDLRRVAEALGRKTVRIADYNAKGRFGSATLQRRFGSWNKAVEASGLQAVYPKGIPKEALLDDLGRAASILGKATLSTAEYRLHGSYRYATVSRAFGSWKQALAAAGIALSPEYRERTPDDRLLENLGRVWEQLGRQPRTTDLVRPVSSVTGATYRNRFGSFRKALEKFVASVKEAQAQDAATTTGAATTTRGDPQFYRHKTSRRISWRLRFLVMRRDNFKCAITGRSPATHPGTELVVDHIVPWDKGGETVLENLQTLCREINVGKSNLDMHVDR